MLRPEAVTGGKFVFLKSAAFDESVGRHAKLHTRSRNFFPRTGSRPRNGSVSAAARAGTRLRMAEPRHRRSSVARPEKESWMENLRARMSPGGWTDRSRRSPRGVSAQFDDGEGAMAVPGKWARYGMPFTRRPCSAGSVRSPDLRSARDLDSCGASVLRSTLGPRSAVARRAKRLAVRLTTD